MVARNKAHASVSEEIGASKLPNIDTYKLYGYIANGESSGLVEPIFSDADGRKYLQEIDDGEMLTGIVAAAAELENYTRVIPLVFQENKPPVIYPYGPALHLFVIESTVWWGARHSASELYEYLCNKANYSPATLLDVGLFAGVDSEKLAPTIRDVSLQIAPRNALEEKILEIQDLLSSQVEDQKSDRFYKPKIWRARSKLTAGWELSATEVTESTSDLGVRFALLNTLVSINSGWYALASEQQRSIDRAIRQLFYSMSSLDNLIKRKGDALHDAEEKGEKDYFALVDARLCCVSLYAFCVVHRYLSVHNPESLAGLELFQSILPESFSAYLHSMPGERLIRLFNMIAMLRVSRRPALKPGFVGVGSVEKTNKNDSSDILLKSFKRTLTVPSNLIAPMDYLDHPPIGASRFFSGTSESFGPNTVSCRGVDHTKAVFQIFFPLEDRYPDTVFIMSASNSAMIVVTRQKIFRRIITGSKINRHMLQIVDLLRLRRLIVLGHDSEEENADRRLISDFCKNFFRDVRPEIIPEANLVRIHIPYTDSKGRIISNDERKIRAFSSALIKINEKLNLQFRLEIWVQHSESNSTLWESSREEDYSEGDEKSAAIYFIDPFGRDRIATFSRKVENNIYIENRSNFAELKEIDGKILVTQADGLEDKTNFAPNKDNVEQKFREVAA